MDDGASAGAPLPPRDLGRQSKKHHKVYRSVQVLSNLPQRLLPLRSMC